MLFRAYGIAYFSNSHVSKADKGDIHPPAGDVDIAGYGLEDRVDAVPLEAVYMLVDGAGSRNY